jgi:hypothetical protein
MQDKINELKKLVGTPYQMETPDGNYLGCFMPVYLLFPDAPRYVLPTDDPAVNYAYGLSKILRECVKVERSDLQAGDIIACQFNNELHVGVMINKNEVIHVFRGHTLQIDRLSSRFLQIRI